MHIDDSRVRLAAFKWLEEQTAIHGDVLPRSLLGAGFFLDGHQIHIVSRQGIFKPAVLGDMPLSLTTSIQGPYDDHFGSDGTLRYAYRGSDPQHHQNVWVRNAMKQQAPLIYCHAVVPGRYLVVWPVYVVGDDPDALMFRVSADEHLSALARDASVNRVGYGDDTDYRRRYATREVRQRLHQQGFRERVLAAYRNQCALCRLRHPELLEAAHIIPDTEPDSQPIVPNGLSLCRLHHGAFDKYLIGIRPDHTVEVRRSVLEEHDGPMLRHGLQGVHNQRIWTPRSAELRPDQSFLERRYERFRKAM
jgi:putative restriction endonuclease